MRIIKEANINSIEYDGKNHDEIKKMVGKSKFKAIFDYDPSKGFKINNIKVFKEDKVSVEKDGVYIAKPSYQGNKKTKVSK